MTTNEQTAAPAATTVKMFRFKNVSAVALPIPELNMIVPKDGYSAPMMEATPTLKEYVKGSLFTQEPLDVPEMPGTGPKAIVQGGAPTETDTKGAVTPLVAGPAMKLANLDYIPPKVSTPGEKLKLYDNQAEVKNAVANTVISIGTDATNFNRNGEIPDDEARRLVKAAGASSFSTEVSGGQYVADEAQRLIAAASGVVAAPRPQDIPVPEGVPAGLLPFFQQTGLQKKIFIYKSASSEYLQQIKGFERDANVISCINQRLVELGK